MKAAFSTWDHRIAPVFDVAPTIVLVEAESGQIKRETREFLPSEVLAQKALRLVELGVQALVCGAISRPLEAMITAYGIRVVAFVSGDIDEIVQAFLNHRLIGKSHGMPGCGARAQRSRNQGSNFQKEVLMVGVAKNNTQQGGGRGRGRGQGGGQGQGGVGPGRKGGVAAGPQGVCVCPQCGQKEAHQRGVPCYERKCTKCGAALVRE